MKYSLIVPVYDRPDEIRDLLESLAGQSSEDFEIIVVEDGSSRPCGDVAARFAAAHPHIPLKYLVKPNSGPGQTRNYGAEYAAGEYLIFLDSDVLVPPGYFNAIDGELERCPADAFGGPDRADESFTPVQKAISYSMTSFFTTGGIRGGRRKLDKFYPRSFNMGVKKDLFKRLGGFSKMRFGEDIDLSIRIFESGSSCRLFPEAWVCHKRRTDFRKFFKQVHNSGIARINLYKKHPSSLKAVHMLPAAFTVSASIMLIAGFFCPWAWLPLLAYAALIFCDALLVCRTGVEVAALSVAAAFVQLCGYGSGFLRAWWERCVLGRGEIQAYRKNFYK